MRVHALKRFVLDETGAISVDAVVVIGGAMLIAQTVVTDISNGMLTIGAKMNGKFEQIAVDQLENAETVYTPERGNPGNDSEVGAAGESPNGSDDWGDGTQGMSQ